VAGIGNIFLGDDAFGVEVSQKLLRRPAREGMHIEDFGIRGIDLTYKLMDGWDAVILIDAVSRGLPPGTIYTIDTQQSDPQADAPLPQGLPLIEAHNLDPAKVLHLVRSMGGKIGQVLLVGCEPTPIDVEQDFQVQLSPPVAAAVDVAVQTVEALIEKLLCGQLITGDVQPTEGAEYVTIR
jgi:hydrogenase maturation protease